MKELTVSLAALAALPAAWWVLVLAERIPAARPLLRPLPAVPFPRGLTLGDVSVYPVTIGLFVLGALRFEPIAVLVLYLLLFVVLLALSVIDIETLRLPDRLTLPTAAVSLPAIAMISVASDHGDAILGALMGAGMYFGVLLLAHLAHPAGMGFGDVKLALVMGLYLGWPTAGGLNTVVVVIWAMLIGFALGSIIGIGMLLLRKRSVPYPFGPFLALGSVVVMLAAPDLLPTTVSTELFF
jgi:leader peptidase (prepilin peptidase)/N-methyltransferase